MDQTSSSEPQQRERAQRASRLQRRLDASRVPHGKNDDQHQHQEHKQPATALSSASLPMIANGQESESESNRSALPPALSSGYGDHNQLQHAEQSESDPIHDQPHSDQQRGSHSRVLPVVVPSSAESMCQSSAPSRSVDRDGSMANSSPAVDGSGVQSSSEDDMTGIDSDEDKGASPGSPTAQAAQTNLSDQDTDAKASRYLREMDRRDILLRISQGEKQSALAKEYNISRSAVCNLHKKREAVLARQIANPLAKHPKINRSGFSKSSSSASKLGAVAAAPAEASAIADVNAGVRDLVLESPSQRLHIMSSSSRAIVVLLTGVHGHETQADHFQRCADRLMRLVLEETMALVQLRVDDVASSDGSRRGASVAGVDSERSTCALTLEQENSPMLDMLLHLEPEMSTGYVRITPAEPAPSAIILQAHLPLNLSGYNVLLLDTVVTSGADVCCAIERAVAQMGAVEDLISVVTLVISSETVGVIAARYPRVQIVTADVDVLGVGDSFAAQSEWLKARCEGLR